MKKKIKSYLAFTSNGYRLWGLVLLPALLFVATYFAFSDLAYDHSWGLFVGGAFILFYEIFSDYWLFGGICGRQAEYLKTSLGGLPLLESALAVDLMRRFLYAMVFSAICYTKSRKPEAFCVGLMIYLMAVGMLNITRYLPGVIQQMMIAFLAVVVFSLYGAATLGMHGGILELVILIAAALAVSIVTVWHVLQRMKGSYYEKESEKGN